MPAGAPDIINDGISFVPNVLATTRFASEGFLIGENEGLHWGVVDPAVHPLNVFDESNGFIAEDYDDAAVAKDAVVFTNGPMMSAADRSAESGVRRLGTKVGVSILVGLGVGAVSVALAPFTGGASVVAGLATVAVLGGATVIIHRGVDDSYALAGWRPYNVVHSASEPAIDWGAGFNTDQFYLARTGTGFAAHRIVRGAGQAAISNDEVIAGLIPLVVSHTALTFAGGIPESQFSNPVSPFGPNGGLNWLNQYRNLHNQDTFGRRALGASGMGGWAIVPIEIPTPPTQPPPFSEEELAELPGTEQGRGIPEEAIRDAGLDPQGLAAGVLVAAATHSSGYNTRLADIFAGIGARDAIALDGGRSVMFGTRANVVLRPTRFKRLIQRYGFYCR